MSKNIAKIELVLLLLVTFNSFTEDNNLIEDCIENQKEPNYRISNLNNKQVFDNALATKLL